MTREIDIRGTRYPVAMHESVGHSVYATCEIGSTTYRGASVCFGSDGAAVASLVAELQDHVSTDAEEV
jgi:hypothetical protein